MNVIFILLFAWNWLNSPSNELGRLEKEIEIGHFQSVNKVFRIPKGVTVKNVSKRGSEAIGQFENERFSIVITSEDGRLVNYNTPKDSLQMFGNFYSAKIPQTNEQQNIPQGSFIYELYFAEFDGRMENVTCRVIIKCKNITVEQTDNTNLTGGKTIIEGVLMKHKSGRWIIGQNPEDKTAEEIGGCTCGPTPIDFETKIIEWC